MDFADPLCALYSISIIQLYLRKFKCRAEFHLILYPSFDSICNEFESGTTGAMNMMPLPAFTGTSSTSSSRGRKLNAIALWS